MHSSQFRSDTASEESWSECTAPNCWFPQWSPPIASHLIHHRQTVTSTDITLTFSKKFRICNAEQDWRCRNVPKRHAAILDSKDDVQHQRNVLPIATESHRCVSTAILGIEGQRLKGKALRNDHSSKQYHQKVPPVEVPNEPCLHSGCWFHLREIFLNRSLWWDAAELMRQQSLWSFLRRFSNWVWRIARHDVS